MAKIFKIIYVGCLLSCLSNASVFTETSPTGSGTALPAFVTSVGGIVTDLVGRNGIRVVAQAPASTLFAGDAVGPNNTLMIGRQLGYGSSIVEQLGPLAEVAFRFSVFDGDTARGNFDYQRNVLLVNGINFGNWSAVQTESTTGFGQPTTYRLSGGGFRDEKLDTGFFYSDRPEVLLALYASLRASRSLTFSIQDATPGDQYYDFREAIDPSLVGAGSMPVIVTHAVPEPKTHKLIALSSLLLTFYLRFKLKRYTQGQLCIVVERICLGA